ncbi:MAG: MBL fold metallo-hydrolase [Chitinispirillaceae bacterium]|nr:MBL fold metallo-hydrolase [Chitinispirillaceae bacterium]
MLPLPERVCRSVLSLLLFGITYPANSQDSITIHNIGHASLCFEYTGTVIHVDPYSSQTDYASQPDADLILITHGHQDHYDLSALNEIKKETTVMVCPPSIAELGTYTGEIVSLENGDTAIVEGFPISAVPAYNISRTNHPQGVGNGYIITLGRKRIYIAGDTELIPAMDSLGAIAIAFIPMNLPYTMSVEMAAEAVKTINPQIAYIYHFSSSDTAALREQLQGEAVEVRMGPSTVKVSDGSETVGTIPERHGRQNRPDTKNQYYSLRTSLMNMDAKALNLQGQLIGAPVVKQRNIPGFPTGVYLVSGSKTVAEHYTR